MIFIVNGRLNRRQALGKKFITTSTVLEAGSFLGEDLLSWCLHQPFTDRLPFSPATFVCLESVEAYGLDACNLRFITEHFRYKFSSDRLMRTMRYYSSNWRTWGAVIIQFAWRRYRIRTRRSAVTDHLDSLMQNRSGSSENLLRQGAALLIMSLRPHDHLE